MASLQSRNDKKARSPKKSAALPSKKWSGALPSGMSYEELFHLWLNAVRHYPRAQSELHRLLTANPKIKQTLKQFAAERENIMTVKYGRPKAAVPKPEQSAWQKMSGGATRWVSMISGGLPSLGKRR